MFDSVRARCPHCDTTIELQSKAGECTLRDYTEDSVPVEIAKDLKGEQVYCEECGENSRFYPLTDLSNLMCRLVKD